MVVGYEQIATVFPERGGGFAIGLQEGWLRSMASGQLLGTLLPRSWGSVESMGTGPSGWIIVRFCDVLGVEGYFLI